MLTNIFRVAVLIAARLTPISVIALAVTSSAVRAEDPSPKTISQQFGLCEMDAIKKMGWQGGNWFNQSGRYLYACMRAAGYDLTSRLKVDGTVRDLSVPDHCIAFDMKRIELPECYEPYGDSRTKQFGLCEMDAIKNMGYEQGDYDGPGGHYLYACMRAAGYELKSHKTYKEGYCTPGDKRITLLPECYQPQQN